MGCTVPVGPKRETACPAAPVHDWVSPATSDFCRQADRIVIAEVRRREYRMVEDSTKRVAVTDVFLVVSHVIKGSGQPGAELGLEVPGGGADGVLMGVAGVPSFELNRDHLLFLAEHQGSHPPAILATSVVPADNFVRLPLQATLVDLWRRLCEANPEGVPVQDLPGARLLRGDCIGGVH